MNHTLSERDPATTSGNSPPIDKDFDPEDAQESPFENDRNDAPVHRGDAAAKDDVLIKKQHRTPGLRLFDILLYPVLNNFSVFAISVVATYLTNRGGKLNDAGELVHGRIGKFFQRRGELLVKKIMDLGITKNPKLADGYKMVAFSFFDGSGIALLVKLFENKREQIGEWLDRQLGTLPPTDAPYEAEPKQTWRSVILGRAMTAGIVVPIAYALGKNGWNETLFYGPGKKIGEWAASKPGITKFFGKWEVPELARVSIFEAFYTSVCTAGLYFSSRFIATLMGEHAKKKKEPGTGSREPAGQAPAISAPIAVAPANEHHRPAANENVPQAHVAGGSLQGRVENVPGLGQGA